MDPKSLATLEFIKNLSKKVENWQKSVDMPMRTGRWPCRAARVLNVYVGWPLRVNKPRFCLANKRSNSMFRKEQLKLLRRKVSMIILRKISSAKWRALSNTSSSDREKTAARLCENRGVTSSFEKTSSQCQQADNFQFEVKISEIMISAAVFSLPFVLWLQQGECWASEDMFLRQLRCTSQREEANQMKMRIKQHSDFCEIAK